MDPLRTYPILAYLQEMFRHKQFCLVTSLHVSEWVSKKKMKKSFCDGPTNQTVNQAWWDFHIPALDHFVGLIPLEKCTEKVINVHHHFAPFDAGMMKLSVECRGSPLYPHHLCTAKWNFLQTSNNILAHLDSLMRWRQTIPLAIRSPPLGRGIIKNSTHYINVLSWFTIFLQHKGTVAYEVSRFDLLFPFR